MKVYDTYGLRTNDLELTREWIEPIVGIMEAHESSYRGQYYRLDISSEENYILQYNYCDDEWTEEEHKDCGILLYINQSIKRDVIRKKIFAEYGGMIEFIDRNTITKDGWDRHYRYINGKDILVSERNLSSLN